MMTENPLLDPHELEWNPGVGPYEFMTANGIKMLTINIPQPTGPPIEMGFGFPSARPMDLRSEWAKGESELAAALREARSQFRSLWPAPLVERIDAVLAKYDLHGQG